ncbi:MAG: hypothetical protein ABIR91_04560 [Candidatus Saccharimonadales bacterium]
MSSFVNTLDHPSSKQPEAVGLTKYDDCYIMISLTRSTYFDKELSTMRFVPYHIAATAAALALLLSGCSAPADGDSDTVALSEQSPVSASATESALPTSSPTASPSMSSSPSASTKPSKKPFANRDAIIDNLLFESRGACGKLPESALAAYATAGKTCADLQADFKKLGITRPIKSLSGIGYEHAVRLLYIGLCYHKDDFTSDSLNDFQERQSKVHNSTSPDAIHVEWFASRMVMIMPSEKFRAVNPVEVFWSDTGGKLPIEVSGC